MNDIVFKTTPYLFVLIVIFVIIANKNSNYQKIQKDVFNYSVIPSLAYFTIGHLVFYKKVREDQGWSDDKGVEVLQREIGIVELSLFTIACFTTDNPKYVSNIFGLMLVLFGFNHIFTSGSDNIDIAIFDILYGSMLLYIFARK